MGLHGKLLRGNQGRGTWRAGGMNQRDAFRDATGMREIRSMEFREGHLTVKSFFQRLLNAFAGERKMPGENKQTNSGENDERDSNNN